MAPSIMPRYFGMDNPSPNVKSQRKADPKAYRGRAPAHAGLFGYGNTTFHLRHMTVSCHRRPRAGECDSESFTAPTPCQALTPFSRQKEGGTRAGRGREEDGGMSYQVREDGFWSLQERCDIQQILLKCDDAVKNPNQKIAHLNLHLASRTLTTLDSTITGVEGGMPGCLHTRSHPEVFRNALTFWDYQTSMQTLRDVKYAESEIKTLMRTGQSGCIMQTCWRTSCSTAIPSSFERSRTGPHVTRLYSSQCSN